MHGAARQKKLTQKPSSSLNTEKIASSEASQTEKGTRRQLVHFSPISSKPVFLPLPGHFTSSTKNVFAYPTSFLSLITPAFMTKKPVDATPFPFPHSHPIHLSFDERADEA